MRKFAAAVAVAALVAVAAAGAQNVKAYKGGGGPTGFSSATGNWVKAYRGNIIPNPGPTAY